jgi:hypothetical protein
MEEKSHFKPWHFAAFATGLWAYFEWKHVDIKQEIRKNIREPGQVLPENEGKPVLASGIVNSSDYLEDKLFNIKVECLKLERKLQQYKGKWQSCQETPPTWMSSEETISQDSFEITPFLVEGKLFKEIPADIKIKPKVLPRSFRDVILSKGFAVYSDDSGYYLSRFKRKSGVYKPVDGDYQVTFHRLMKGQLFTILGQQEGNFISFYRSPHLPRPVIVIKPGLHSLESMLEDLPSQSLSYLFALRALSASSICFSLFLRFYTTSTNLNSKP